MRPGQRRLLLIALVAALIVVGFCCYGLGSGGGFYYKLVRDPLRADASAPYYRESILHVALAHWLGLAGSITGFRVAVLACFWAALGYLAVVLNRRLSLVEICAVLLVSITHPAAMIVYAWTCHPDALTLLLTAVLLFSRRTAVIGVVAALGVWCHLAMWLVIVVQVVALRVGFNAGPRRLFGAIALGVGAGVVSHRALLWWCGISIGTDRFGMAAKLDLATLVSFWTGPGPAIVYTLYFAHLLWVPSLLLMLRQEHRRGALALIACQLLALAAAFVSRDTTRVFALLAWGPLVYGLVHALGRERGAREYGLRPLLGLAVAVSLAAPKCFAWEGRLHGVEGARAHLRALLGSSWS